MCSKERRLKEDDRSTHGMQPASTISNLHDIGIRPSIYKEIYHSVNEGIAIMDENGGFIIQNPAHEKLFGYSLDEIAGKNYGFMSSEQLFKEVFIVFNYLGHFAGEIEYTSKTGEKVMAEVSFIRIESEDDPKYILSIIKDITRIKNVQKALQDAKRKAEKANRMKTTYLSNMSHEIRTPMNAILGFSSLLDDVNIEREKRKEYIEYIHTNGHNLLNLISDILDVAKIESGHIQIQETNCSVMDILDNLQAIMQEELNQMGKEQLKLVKKSPVNPAEILTDRDRVHQILVNLIYNALKFTEKGKVEFGFRLEEQKWIVFYVKDTGIGISPERIEKIFDRFEKAGAHSRNRIQGSGLGLSISRQLAELLGGKIEVESTPGKGSVFYFHLPFKPMIKKEEKVAKARIDINKLKFRKSKILIIEDDHFSFELLQEILSPAGMNIVHINSGEKAIEYLQDAFDLDLIIIDIRLPGISGLEIIKRLRRERRTLPILAYTANAMRDELNRAFSSGINDIIVKPVSKTVLLKKIHKYLGEPL